MTQDQCLDNGHQAISNNHSTNDQVSDDLNNAKNSIVSNGVNSVQEFNVDVNSKRSENRADVAIVQNRVVEIDANSPPSRKVFATSEQPAATSSDIVNLSVNSNNFIIATDLNKSECSHNILLTDMTVITHQNSSENIRDIIANSDQVNKDAIDSQITEVGNNVKSEQNAENENSVNKAGTIKQKINSSKREKNNKDESDKPEDPVARLNKLRASISSALSEVKGVLKQYSTEQSLDGENESTPSLQPASEDGPVRFRFVRKIRRRSAYSEDDENSQEVKSETTTTVTNVEPKENDDHLNKIDDNDKISSIIIKNEIVSDEVSNIPKGDHVPCQLEDKQAIKTESSHLIKTKELTEVNKTQPLLRNVSEVSLIETKETPQEDKIQSHNCIEENNQPKHIVQPTAINQTPPTRVHEEINQSENVVGGKKIKQNSHKADPSVQTTAGSMRAKCVKLKKVVKKDRRASIAAVEANQVLPDKSLPQLELKTQRRPSDSGTLVKQPPLVKQKAKISEKSKSHLQRPVKAAAVSKTEVPAAPVVSQQSEPAIVSENSIEPFQNTTILPTATHEQISVTEANEPPPPLQQDNTTSAIEEEVLTVTESNILPTQAGIQTQSKITSPTVTHDNVVVTKTNETPAKVEVSHITQTVNTSNQLEVVASAPAAVKSKKKTSSETSIPNKAKNNAGSNDNATKIIQTQSKITSPTVTYDSVPMTKTIETPAKVEVSRMTQTVIESNSLAVVASAPAAVKSQPKPSSKTSIVNKAKYNAGSNDKATINEFPKQNKDDDSMPTSEKTAIPAPTRTEDHTASAVPQPLGDVPSNETVKETNLKEQTKAEEHMCIEEDDTLPSKSETPPEVTSAPPKKKRKAKRKVVIRRIKRKLSKDDTFIHTQEAPAELEIEEKEIEEKDPDDEEEDELETVPKQRKSCLKARQFEIGDVVMYAERFRKTQVKWKKAIVIERITSISYKLDIDGEEKPAHISYIKKFTNRKVNFGGKEYLEIDYAQIEEDEEKERNYSIWNLV